MMPCDSRQRLLEDRMRFLSTFALVTCLALAACASPREPVTNLPAAYQAPPSAGLDLSLIHI